MTRAALVMGFGYGRANRDIAQYVAGRNNAAAFDHILTQQAVLDFLQETPGHAAVSPMHVHCRIYVDTLDAIGLGLLKLHRVVPGDAALEIEILAHSLQFERATRTGGLALTLLKGTPGSSPGREAFLQFVDSITLAQPAPPEPMALNRLSESWRQPWTCSRLLYRTMEAVARERDFNARRRQFEENPRALYEHLIDLERRLEMEKNAAVPD